MAGASSSIQTKANTTSLPTTRPELDTAAAVLGFARASRTALDRADADLLHAAATWAEQHPPEPIGLEATWPGTQGELSLAGESAPDVAESNATLKPWGGTWPR